MNTGNQTPFDVLGEKIAEVNSASSRRIGYPDEACARCREEGHLTLVCDECLDKFASYGMHVLDLRATALRTFEMFHRMDALEVPDVLIEAQCRLLEQHLIEYLPERLREPCRSEIALWRARVAARKTG